MAKATYKLSLKVTGSYIFPPFNMFACLHLCESNLSTFHKTEENIKCIGLGKDFSLKLTILLHDFYIEILTVVEYNLYA